MAWIADGESGADVRAKLNALAIPIESGTISSPVEYLDIDLPSGYEKFATHLTDISFDTNDEAAFLFSADGGATFIGGDGMAFDTYRHDAVFAGTEDGGTDGLCVLTGFQIFISDNPAFGSSIVLQISPGSASRTPVILADAALVDAAGVAGATVGQSAFMFNDAAGSPAANTRVNLIRFLPYGNGDGALPTSGETITSGSYFLYGIPTP